MTNIMGLSTVRASHIFPLSLKNHIAVFAIFKPVVGETISLVFRNSAGNESFPLNINLGSAEEVQADDSGKPVGAGMAIPGWHLHCLPLDVEALVKEPGEFQVFYQTPQGEIQIGAVLFVHVPVAPFTPDEIAALRSDPFALKVVRITLACRVCGHALKPYSGLEKNEVLEADGYTRDEDLPNHFRCECGQSEFSLAYLKTGLRGILRRRSQAMVKAGLDYVRLYESSALEEKCRQFRKLLDENGPEERLQEFLEKNPIFFARFNPQRLKIKSPVLAMRKVDFAILNERKELLLIEIENSSTPLLKKDGGIKAELQHAADQVREWLQIFADHRAAALAGLDLKLENVARVRGIVIAGRTPTDDGQARLLRSVGWPDIDFYTFDDLTSGVVEILRHVAA